MTVAELIELLKNYPNDLDVIVDGYEGGYHVVTHVEIEKITTEKVNSEWYYGEYETDQNGKEAVYIPRYAD